MSLTSFMLPVYDLGSEKCRIGNVYKFTFTVQHKMYGLTRDVLAWLVNSQDKFEVESAEYNEKDELEILCKVVKNPLPFLVVFGIVVAGASTLMLIFGLTLTKVEKVMEITGVQALSIAGALVAVKLFFFT